MTTAAAAAAAAATANRSCGKQQQMLPEQQQVLPEQQQMLTDSGTALTCSRTGAICSDDLRAPLAARCVRVRAWNLMRASIHAQRGLCRARP